jgi:hypothetical protein
MLPDRARGDVSALASIPRQVEKAIERAMDLTYDQFSSQVVAYLVPEHADSYGSREAWDAMQAQAVETLQKALP